MKFKRLISYLIFYLITLIILCINVKGNLELVGPDIKSIIIFQYISLFLVNIVVEFIIIYLFTRNLIDKWSRLSRSIFAVNFFTFPTTQILAISLISRYSFNIGHYCLIELLPIVFECLFFLKIYPDLRIPIKNSTILLSTISANLATFAIGLLVGIPQMIIFF